jgi:hypothetical protein
MAIYGLVRVIFCTWNFRSSCYILHMEFSYANLNTFFRAEAGVIAEFILETGNSSNMNPGADEFPVRTFPSNLPV